MAKYEFRLKARALRRAGSSIKDISRTLKVSKSSASAWCNDIILSKAQTENLHRKMIVGGYSGRLKGSQANKARKIARIKMYEEEGLKVLGEVSNRDILLMGLGLYLGEGAKSGNRVRFSNSNPSIIRLFITWMEKSLGVSRSSIFCRVMINEIHRKREKIVREQWARILDLPLQQFQKTTFIKVRNKKIYENYDTYLGTVSVSILKSSNNQYRILGLMKNLMYKVGKEPA